jgi:hypothetical protein|tara:strand:- start:1157 stop:1450 length:294 start_codon:yes stop_codon:yes gene_type:complete
MNVWIVLTRMDSEQYVTAHLTEKGAYLTAINEVVDYLGIDEEYFADIEDEEEYPEWRGQALKQMKRNELSGVYGEWCERLWDNYEYSTSIEEARMQP